MGPISNPDYIGETVGEHEMRLVNIRNVQEGAVLARPVLSATGKVLLQAGVALTASYIDRLYCLGFDVVFVEDAELDDVEIYVPLSVQTRELAYQTVKKIGEYIADGEMGELHVDLVRATVLRMIDDLMLSYDILGNLSEIRGYDDYTFHHSVNTTVLALILGIALGYPEAKLLELGMGVLMHDVGKIRVPEDVLNKRAPLTAAEFEEIKKHPVYGFEILRRCEDLSILAAHVALQHQEKWDGSGYPRGLKEEKIHEYGRIAAVADVYEALTSRRVYRGAVEPYQAYEYIIANSGCHFEPRLVKVFAKSIAIYPTGSGVILSNGERGNVVRQNPSFPNRPHVRVFYHGEERLRQPIDYNLAEHPSLIIVGVENF